MFKYHEFLILLINNLKTLLIWHPDNNCLKAWLKLVRKEMGFYYSLLNCNCTLLSF